MDYQTTFKSWVDEKVKDGMSVDAAYNSTIEDIKRLHRAALVMIGDPSIRRVIQDLREHAADYGVNANGEYYSDCGFLTSMQRQALLESNYIERIGTVKALRELGIDMKKTPRGQGCIVFYRLNPKIFEMQMS